MDQERIYVIVTFLLDGVSATMTMRDLKMMNGKRYSNPEQLREGDTVLAYWQNDQDYFEAILRRFSESPLEINKDDKKKWETEAKKIKNRREKIGSTQTQEAEAIFSQLSEELGRQHESSSKSKARERSRSRSPQRRGLRHPSRSRSSSRSRPPSPSSSRPASMVAPESAYSVHHEMKQRLDMLEKLVRTMVAPPQEDEEGMITLSSRFPNVRVDVSLLKQKISAGSNLAKIKGVYDLVLSRKEQARFSGKGRGKFQKVPEEIFGALNDFFSKRLKTDASTLIVEAINEKGAQARLQLSRVAKERNTFQSE